MDGFYKKTIQAKGGKHNKVKTVYTKIEMSEQIGWGLAAPDNNIFWGQGSENDIAWGIVYASSYSNQTIIGLVGDFMLTENGFKRKFTNNNYKLTN